MRLSDLRQAAHHRLRRGSLGITSALPRGCLDDVRELLDATWASRPTIRDERVPWHDRWTSRFHGELRPEQQAAARASLAHDIGVLSATTAFGKTVVAAWLIAQRGVEYARPGASPATAGPMGGAIVERFSDVPRKSSVGSAADAGSRPGIVDVAIIQSLVRKGVVDDRVETTAISSSTNATTCPRTASSRWSGERRRGSSRGCPRPSLARTATIRSSSCSADRFDTGSTPGHRRLRVRSSTIVLVRPTAFQTARTPESDRRMEFQTAVSGAGRGRGAQSADLRRCGRVGARRHGRRSCSRNGTNTWIVSSEDSQTACRHLVAVARRNGQETATGRWLTGLPPSR